MNHLEWLFEFIEKLTVDGYTGKIEVSFFKGGIAVVNKFESIKPPKTQTEG